MLKGENMRKLHKDKKKRGKAWITQTWLGDGSSFFMLHVCSNQGTEARIELTKRNAKELIRGVLECAGIL